MCSNSESRSLASGVLAHKTRRIDLESTSPSAIQPVSPILLGVCGMLISSVLAFGAVERWSIALLECGAGGLFVLWMGREIVSGQISVRPSPLYAPGGLLIGIIAVQIGFSATAYRYITVVSALQFVAFGIVFFVTLQTASGVKSAQVIFRIFAVFGFALAIFAITQDLSGNGKIYWVRQVVRDAEIFGPYVNHNHYAGLMEMLVPFPLVLSFSDLLSWEKRILAAVAASFIASTIVLSLSRGGTASLIVEIVFLLCLLRSPAGKQRSTAFLVTICILTASFVLFLGTAPLWQHLTDLKDTTRLSITKDALRMLVQRPLLGWGLGTFPMVYPHFRSFYTNLFINAAHNDYVQILAETGVLGCVAVLWFLFLVYREGLRHFSQWQIEWNAALTLAALTACTGLLVHSFVDFNLQIPSNAIVFYFMCALATGTHELRGENLALATRLGVEA